VKRAIFGFTFLMVSFLCLFAYAQDFEQGRIVGDKKYFGRDYIVRNPRATLPPPSGIPLAKMDLTQEECFGWTEDQTIGSWIYPAYAPRVAVVGDTIHVVWEQCFYSKFTHQEVCYVRSTDRGVTWSDSILLSVTDGVESVTPDIAVEQNNLYVVWEDWTSMDWGGIYFRKSTDGGTTWQSIIPIALRGVDDYDYYRPTMVVKDSSVFVAFAKNVDSDGMFKFKKSTNRGETWSQEIHISDRAVTGHWPKMVLNSAGLYATHQNGLSIWCNKSTNWGDTWSSDIFISDMENSTAQWPSIGADNNGGVYVTWFDYKYSPYGWTGDIFLRKSSDNGQTWDSITMLTDNHLCIESDICADTSSVHVVWHDERHGGGNTEIYHRRSTDSGFSWGQEDRGTEAPYESLDPRIIANEGKLYLTWIDSRDYPEDRHVYFKKGDLFIPGDVNSDRVVNSADIIFLINYLFIAGPPPNIFKSGDANSDGLINSADVAYLINFLFIGGPSPVDC
jgi:hypothetical protein